MRISDPVSLAAALPSLHWLFHGLAGEALPLQPRRQPVPHGARARAILDAQGLFLPEDLVDVPAAGAAGAEPSWVVWRAAVAHAVAHWRYSPRRQSGRGLKPMGHAVVGALEDARVEYLLARELPGVRRWFAAAFPPVPAGARRDDFEGLLARLHWALADPAHEDGHGWIAKARGLFEQLRAQGALAQPGPLREAASILANDLGQMRLRMNLQGFYVPAPYRDDNSYLWDLGEAGEPPPEQQVQVPTRGQAAPPPPEGDAEDDKPDQDDAEQGAATAPADPVPFFYPEWDYRLERLRPDWCTLYERLPLRGTAAATVAARMDSAHARWRPAARLDRHRRLRRQWQGDELDLDAAIDWQADRRARRDPSPRIFRDAGRAPPPLSLLVLVDLSESCNDPLGATGGTLLDLQKQALDLLARRLDTDATRLAIHGFCSDTRHSVSYFRMLDFGQRFDAAAASAVGALQARWSTRLGAALRHATQLAAAEAVARRAIVVVSDGAPSDIDVFDARYLVADARAAVHAARRAGVAVAGLVVGNGEGDGALSQARTVYGSAGYCAVREPGELAARLFGLLGRLAR